MCCFFGFIKWSISCIHRLLTFVLGFWLVLTILYALALAISSGVAFGYNYCLAEYKTLARPDVVMSVKSREYVPEVLSRRNSEVRGILGLGDEYRKEAKTDELVEEHMFSPPYLWLYEHSRPTPSTRRVAPSTPATDTVRIYHRVSKAEVTTEEEKAYTMAKKQRELHTRALLDTELRLAEILQSAETAEADEKAEAVDTANTIEIVEPDESAESESTEAVKASETVETTETDEAYILSEDTDIDKYSDISSSATVATSRSSKMKGTNSPSPVSRTSRPDITDLSTNSPRPSKVMRVFVPKSTSMQWRPTRPNKHFFYKTPSTARTRRTKEDPYHPEMEIRTFDRSSFGKYDGPLRHWDMTTKATETLESSFEDNIYKNFLYF